MDLSSDTIYKHNMTRLNYERQKNPPKPGSVMEDMYEMAELREAAEAEERIRRRAKTVGGFLDGKYSISLSNDVLFLNDMFNSDETMEEQIAKTIGHRWMDGRFRNAYEQMAFAVSKLEEAVQAYKSSLDNMGTLIDNEGGNAPFDYTPID